MTNGISADSINSGVGGSTVGGTDVGGHGSIGGKFLCNLIMNIRNYSSWLHLPH